MPPPSSGGRPPLPINLPSTSHPASFSKCTYCSRERETHTDNLGLLGLFIGEADEGAAILNKVALLEVDTSDDAGDGGLDDVLRKERGGVGEGRGAR